MAYLGHSSTHSNQWESYKQLELVPGSVCHPSANAPSFLLGLDRVWRGFLELLIDELIHEQCVEYLDRCWELELGKTDDSSSSSLQRLWMLMN